MRVMVGVIILYDHVHPVGAFAKGSSIDVYLLHFILQQHTVSLLSFSLNITVLANCGKLMGF